MSVCGAIDRALASHRGDPICGVYVGFKEWRAFCREVGADARATCVFYREYRVAKDLRATGVTLLVEATFH